MSADDWPFDFRDLLATTLDSRGILQAFGFDQIEGPAVAIENGQFSRVLPIPAQDTICVLRIDLHQSRLIGFRATARIRKEL
jgi:hypothetical protein